MSCERFVIQLDLTTSDVVATDEEVVELPFDAFPIFDTRSSTSLLKVCQINIVINQNALVRLYLFPMITESLLPPQVCRPFPSPIIRIREKTDGRRREGGTGE